MADLNRESEQLAALLRQANEELARFGQLTQGTADAMKDAEMKQKYGVDNFTKSTKTAADALGQLAQGALSTFRAMADGKKGAAAFNEGLDNMAKSAQLAAVALTLLIPGGPLIKGLVAAFTAVAVTVIQARAEFQKMAAVMSDKLYKAYSDLAKAGAGAASGMSGVNKLSQQLSLNMDELTDLTGIVAGNSQELALFGGSAREGVKRLGDMGEAMRANRKEFIAMGMSVTDVVEGQARYLREMSRTGRAQNMTNLQLAESARNYIMEQDRLAQITGMNAKQQQEVLDRAKSHEMFNAKIRQLELKGDAQSLAAADELKKGLIMAASIGPQAEAGYKAMVTGNLRSADAQRLNFTTAGTAQREILAVATGQKKASQAFDNITKSVARHERTVGLAISQLSESSTVQLSSAEMERAAVQSGMSMEQREQAARDDQAKRSKTISDKLLEGQTQLIDAQINANQEINKLVTLGIPAAQRGMIDVAKASVEAAKTLAKLAGVYKAEDTSTKEEKAAQTAVETSKAERDAVFKDASFMQKYFGVGMTPEQKKAQEKYEAALQERRRLEEDRMERETGSRTGGIEQAGIPGADRGGLLVGPETGYLAMLHGRELVVPEDKLQGKVTTGGMAGAGGPQIDKMDLLYKDMLFDSQELAKLKDADVRKTRDFDRTADKLRKLKSKLMDEEVELLEEQNADLEKAVQALEKVSGKDVADAFRKNFKLAKSLGSTMSATQALTTGLQMPNMPGMPQQVGTGAMAGAPTGQIPGFGAQNRNAQTQGSANYALTGGTGQESATPQMASTAAPRQGGGQGLKMPEPHEPVGTGGQGLKPREQPRLTSVRSKTGKSTAVNSEYAPRFQALIDYLDGIGYEIKSLGGFVDRDVRGKPGQKSVHAHGGAIDINPAANPMGSQLITDMPANIAAISKSLGLGWGGNWTSVKDAMHFSVAKHEGGEIKLSEGGVAVGPKEGYPATLHGEEAVIPLNNNAGNFVKLFEEMNADSKQMLAMMQEMVRAQRDSVSVANKMLRVAQN